MAAPDITAALTLILRGTRSADSLESQTLDFKTDKPSDKETCQDLTEAAVCFANSLGDSSSSALPTRSSARTPSLGPRSVNVVRARIHALTEPSLVVTVEELQHAGALLLVISVPEGLDVHSTKKGLVTRRWDTECLPMRPMDVSRLHDERRGADWTSQSNGRLASEVDPDAVLRLRILLRSAQDESRRQLGPQRTPIC